MPFSFLGTYNRSQFNRLVAYARNLLPYIDARTQHLTSEQQRIGFLQFAFDVAGKPTSYLTGTPGTITYIGKLMSAYEVLGGDPFYDLQVRSMSNPVFYLKGDEVSTSKVMSNGEPIPQAGLSDATSGDAVRSIKGWMTDNLDKLERLERKIRRALDYSDQLQSEINLLKKIRQSVEVDGSLENLVAQVTQLLTDPSYRSITDDKGSDPFGKFIYAPLSSYDGGGDRAAPDGVTIERTGSGVLVSGQGST